MAYGYNTSANQTRNNSYSYTPGQEPKTSVTNGDKTFNYSEIYDNKNPESSASATKNTNTKSSATGVWGVTMGQVQNFTFAIAELCNADNSFSLKNREGMFLPLKSMEYKPVKLDHFKIKAGIFNDLPFFHRRSMGTIQCVMLDSSKSLLSRKLQAWYQSCVNTAGFVPYVDEMCRVAEYTEYTHDGKVSVKYKFMVIPDGDVSVSRSYEGEGALTEYKFNLVIVSNIGTSGSSSPWAEADWGWGDGDSPAAQYERRVYGGPTNTDQFPYIADPSIASQYNLR